MIWIFTGKKNYAKIFNTFWDILQNVSKKFPFFSYSSKFFIEKMDTWVMRNCIFAFCSYKKPSQTSLYGLNTSLVGQKTLYWKKITIFWFLVPHFDDLVKIAPLNLRARSENVKINYRITLGAKFWNVFLVVLTPIQHILKRKLRPQGDTGSPQPIIGTSLGRKFEILTIKIATF